MSEADQLAVMDRMGIDQAVILMISGPEASAELQGIDEVLGICKRNPGRFIPFCNIDPRLKGSYFYKVDAAHFEFLLNQYKDLGCKGMGELCSAVPWDYPGMLALLEACQSVGFPITFHTNTANSNDYGLRDEVGLPLLEKVLKKFPDLVFLAHSQGFWTEISGQITEEDKWGYPEGSVKPGGAVQRLMRAYPNLYGDLSATSGYNALARDPRHAYEFIDEFQDQLVFGMDFCSTTNERTLLNWLRDGHGAGRISNEAFEKITNRNIAGVLKKENE